MTEDGDELSRLLIEKRKEFPEGPAGTIAWLDFCWARPNRPPKPLDDPLLFSRPFELPADERTGR